MSDSSFFEDLSSVEGIIPEEGTELELLFHALRSRTSWNEEEFASFVTRCCKDVNLRPTYLRTLGINYSDGYEEDRLDALAKLYTSLNIGSTRTASPGMNKSVEDDSSVTSPPAESEVYEDPTQETSPHDTTNADLDFISAQEFRDLFADVRDFFAQEEVAPESYFTTFSKEQQAKVVSMCLHVFEGINQKIERYQERMYRGVEKFIPEEVERQIHEALSVLNQTKFQDDIAKHVMSRANTVVERQIQEVVKTSITPLAAKIDNLLDTSVRELSDRIAKCEGQIAEIDSRMKQHILFIDKRFKAMTDYMNASDDRIQRLINESVARRVDEDMPNFLGGKGGSAASEPVPIERRGSSASVGAHIPTDTEIAALTHEEPRIPSAFAFDKGTSTPVQPLSRAASVSSTKPLQGEVLNFDDYFKPKKGK